MESLYPRWWDYVLACIVFLALAAIGGVMLAGCSCPRAYVAGDRATYSAVTPEYLDYLRHDPRLTAEQVARRERTVESWRLRIEELERRWAGE